MTKALRTMREYDSKCIALVLLMLPKFVVSRTADYRGT